MKLVGLGFTGCCSLQYHCAASLRSAEQLLRLSLDHNLEFCRRICLDVPVLLLSLLVLCGKEFYAVYIPIIFASNLNMFIFYGLTGSEGEVEKLVFCKIDLTLPLSLVNVTFFAARCHRLPPGSPLVFWSSQHYPHRVICGLSENCYRWMLCLKMLPIFRGLENMWPISVALNGFVVRRGPPTPSSAWRLCPAPGSRPAPTAP
jgi:hypothetical protein